MARVELRILGPTQVAVDGRPVALTGRPLLLVTRLALAGGVPVSTARLLADLWPEGGGSEGAVRVTLTRVRKALGEHAVVRRDQGYVLSDVAVDRTAFERAVTAGRDRSSSLARRIAAFDEADDAWAGPALDGLDPLPWVVSEARRLEELREQALDERFELLLLVGEHERALPLLRAALERTPTRERRAELLAIALYRAGRQADALDVLARTAAELRERLGLEPGPSLRQVEQQVLQHDPELATSVLERRDAAATEVEARLRAAVSLLRAGVLDEARVIIDESEQVARDLGDRRSLGEVLLARAQLSMLSGDGDPHRSIDQARQLGRELRDGRLLSRAALVRFGAGVPDDKTAALVELTEPLELLSPTAGERVDLLCAAAVIVTFIDASSAAERLVAEAERLHDRSGSERSRGVLLVAQSLLGAVRGDPPGAVDATATEAYELARSLEDPTLVVVAAQARLRSAYSRGDLNAVEELLDPLDRAARAALLPFGIVRVLLSRATNAFARGELDRVGQLTDAAAEAGERMRTFAIHGATRAQRLLLAFERCEFSTVVAAAQRLIPQHGASVWNAVAAACGDDAQAATLASLAPHVTRDDSFWPFVAFASEVVARRRDRDLGAWCAEQLGELGERTVTVGLGTAVIGFGPHFTGLAYVGSGRFDDARAAFARAVTLADHAGAWLWRGHSTVELADVLARLGDEPAATALLADLAPSPLVGRSPRLQRRVAEVADRLGQ